MIVSADLAKGSITVDARLRSAEDAADLINAIKAASDAMYAEQIVFGEPEGDDDEEIESVDADLPKHANGSHAP